jgi:hypothetical protein
VEAQALQVASSVLSADAVKYSPAGQVVFFAEQLVVAFVPSLNSVVLHSVHVEFRARLSMKV